MRRAFFKIWISVVGIAVATSVAGCGGAPGASSPSSPAVDPNVAFKQYEEAAKPFECSPLYGEMGDAAQVGDFDVMKDKARKFRNVVVTWDAALAEIAIPAAAQPIVDGMRELNASELAGLNALADVDGKDADRINIVRTQVEVDDSSVTVEGDRLRAALGHPLPQGLVVADQLEMAERTYWRDVAPVSAKWNAALAASDLNGAKAANAIDEAATQRYIDKLGTIDWPPGTFEGQANTLREHLRELIEFDRHQVDVATTAQIVQAPEGGLPAMKAADDAKEALWLVLARFGQSVDPSKC
jgi:hypothetical protein